MAIRSETTTVHRNWTHDSVGLAAAVLKMLEQLEAETVHRGLGAALREAYARQAEAAQAV